MPRPKSLTSFFEKTNKISSGAQVSARLNPDIADDDNDELYNFKMKKNHSSLSQMRGSDLEVNHNLKPPIKLHKKSASKASSYLNNSRGEKSTLNLELPKLSSMHANFPARGSHESFISHVGKNLDFIIEADKTDDPKDTL